MEIAGIICGSILSVFAIVLGIYVSFTIRCKGPLLSNPWIWMSKEERERELAKVDIKAEYRQLTIALGGLTLVFLYFAIFCFSTFRMPLWPMWIIVVFVVLYAIVSSIKFAMRDKGK
ncbi:MAG: DUF3784 domain-containing protein [Oscillospiraceae bacterium]|jgi:hypothetical protein|nr:DUF3784 domain-containing protein [Oscillospiraceae bacterium]